MIRLVEDNNFMMHQVNGKGRYIAVQHIYKQQCM